MVASGMRAEQETGKRGTHNTRGWPTNLGMGLLG